MQILLAIVSRQYFSEVLATHGEFFKNYVTAAGTVAIATETPWISLLSLFQGAFVNSSLHLNSLELKHTWISS